MNGLIINRWRYTLYIYMYVYIYTVYIYIYVYMMFACVFSGSGTRPFGITTSNMHEHVKFLLKSLCHLSIGESWPVKISVWMAWWQDNHILKYISSDIHILYIHNYIQSHTYSHPAYTCIIHYLIIYAYTQNSTWNKNAMLYISYHTSM